MQRLWPVLAGSLALVLIPFDPRRGVRRGAPYDHEPYGERRCERDGLVLEG